MKNTINYFYNIEVKDYKKRNTSFIFYLKEDKYEFIEYYGDINKLMNIYSIVKMHGRICDEIIRNKDNGIVTSHENKPYILLKKNNNYFSKILLDEIVKYNCNVYMNNSLKWKQLWEEKIDYYELQIEDLGSKYSILKESFNYYKGLSELALNLLNYVEEKNIIFSISHIRIEKKEDLLNPLNIIIDSRVRDIAEYIKIQFLNENINYGEIIYMLYKKIFNKDEIILLFSRLLYPSYYFDSYEKFYNSSDATKELLEIIKKNSSYEEFLSQLYIDIKKVYNIPRIDFLEN